MEEVLPPPRLSEISTLVKYHHSSRIRIHLEDQEINIVAVKEAAFCHLERNQLGAGDHVSRIFSKAPFHRSFLGGGRLTGPHVVGSFADLAPQNLGCSVEAGG